ncbi:glycerate kinase [Paenibacillus mucilaginosus]|uniref:Glycerate kinase n=1 Tax=Paenibacillus mucilaginosus (strain KNP414) TaxID=1036673 RepID=F8FJT8_PAEMK|nr:glycerate kinase [Paenibacillus mucilaginosus]AEI43419.1 Glycerate kinase [Paenibacillus mucilaginosus KNP414]MCG7212034.1 glycerate kinase [Paenibacillus mucilaginosus]WDM24980.1 glycerate kinase [Paenibacillus mucilaginosus]
MRIIAAPDSYKGSLSAVAASAAMERGIRSVFPDAEVVKVPIADGGEGTVEALVAATGGTLMYERVAGPLGRPVDACWGILGDGATGVIEMAAASGLMLVPAEERNPLITSTYGTGQLIKAALDRGLRRLIIGLGGSATNDGGAGMTQALGARLLASNGEELPPGGAALAELHTMDLSRLDPRLAGTEISAACDVDNPLCGPRGASAVYGPQKGATPAMVERLDAALRHYAAVAEGATGRDAADYPGAGAAGGLGAGLLYFTNARLRPGIRLVLDAAGFDRIVQGADLVITGEGATDYQTAYGKAPVGVAAIAGEAGVPTVCLSGSLGTGADEVLNHGVDGLMSIVPRPMELSACMAEAEELLEAASARLCRLLRIGAGLRL